MDEADERAWVTFAAAALGGLYASGYSSGRSPHLVAAEMADELLAELVKRREAERARRSADDEALRAQAEAEFGGDAGRW